MELDQSTFTPRIIKALTIWIAVILVAAGAFPPFTKDGGLTQIALKYFAVLVLSAILAGIGLAALTAVKWHRKLKVTVGLGFGWAGGLIVGMIYAASITPIGEASAWNLMTTIPCVFFCGVGGAISALFVDSDMP